MGDREEEAQDPERDWGDKLAETYSERIPLW